MQGLSLVKNFMSYTGNIWNNINNSGHLDSRKIETAAGIKKT